MTYEIQVPLTKGYAAVIDAVDCDLAEVKWHYDCGYVKRNVPSGVRRQKHVALHRIILARMLGRELMRGEEVDHINGNPLDNRRSNLRLATHAQNSRNRKHRAGSRAPFKGAAFHRETGKWQSSITVDGKRIYLGLFATPEEAHKAYERVAIQYHGDYARVGTGGDA